MTTTTQPTFVRSIDTTQIADLIRKLDIGQTLSYDTMRAAIGRDPQREARGALDSARRVVLKEDGIVTACVPKVGVKRLDDGEIVDAGAQSLTHIRRTAGRAAVRLTKVRDYAALPREAQTRHNLHLTLFQLIKHETSAPHVKRLGEAVDKAAQPLAIGSALDLCK